MDTDDKPKRRKVTRRDPSQSTNAQGLRQRQTSIRPGRGGSTGYKRSTAQREFDQSFIARLYLQGKPLREINTLINDDPARPYTLGPTTVQRDLTICRAQWMRESSEAISQEKILNLKRLDWLLSEATEAWEQSKIQFVRQTQKETKSGNGKDKGNGEDKGDQARTEISATTETRYGNPALLGKMLDIIVERCKILGLARPENEPPVIPPLVNFALTFETGPPPLTVVERTQQQDIPNLRAIILHGQDANSES